MHRTVNAPRKQTYAKDYHHFYVLSRIFPVDFVKKGSSLAKMGRRELGKEVHTGMLTQ